MKALRYNSATAIVFKNFWKKHVFSFSGIYGLISPPPHPHINVENVISVLHAWTGVIKITNIDMGEWGKKWVNGGKITEDRSRDVFQNIFEHDCRRIWPQIYLICDLARIMASHTFPVCATRYARRHKDQRFRPKWPFCHNYLFCGFSILFLADFLQTHPSPFESCFARAPASSNHSKE